MSLTLDTGPFGRQPAGAWNFDPHPPKRVLYFEDSPRRVRVEFAGATVADSRRMKLLHETNLPPVYYFPREDVDFSVLAPTERHTRCPVKGQASYWSVRAGDRVAENAVWGYPDPLEQSPWLAAYVAFDSAAMDAWYEEDERIFAHPRDPYHRVDVLRSSRHVEVSHDGEVLAESTRPRMLLETGLPVRYYLPPEDVRVDLKATDTETWCPYKGRASYWSAAGVDDAAWSYEEPFHEAEPVRGYLCFDDDRVTVTVDGERVGG